MPSARLAFETGLMQAIAAENNLSETAFSNTDRMIVMNCAGLHPLKKWIFVDMQLWQRHLLSFKIFGQNLAKSHL